MSCVIALPKYGVTDHGDGLPCRIMDPLYSATCKITSSRSHYSLQQRCTVKANSFNEAKVSGFKKGRKKTPYRYFTVTQTRFIIILHDDVIK